MNKRILLLVLSIIFAANLWAQEFTAMSYNIRYANENDGENSWSNRKSFLANQLKFYHPDIFGVQEALAEQVYYLEKQLPTYNRIGIGRDGEEKGEFSAVFYDTTKFEMLSNNTFWLSETPDKISKGWDASLNRICTYVLLEDKESGAKIYFFNTHFDHQGDKARINSARLIVEKIKEINTENYPVFLTGDFNLESTSAPIQYVKSFLNDAAESSAEIKLGPSGTYNDFNFSKPVTHRIDYVFYSDLIKVNTYAVLSDNEGGRYASDHLPVFVKVEVR
ncbi:endonuclease/exonuclease/phosphatase family protein [Mesonia aestuariivivens]|uniref:Endonuclease/exonuclease/phosphatase family protein n=1 Tax=Mesonia aestuariivivens TaxID=2796128 RepID=A0ABS6VZ70_9FLAO|nr:endonuclease/exonuclease/phosphatase family protein [Mesonia aestuariivivens]MBW2960877.1 endonuclease/exonuclease/phosphatase family protein [Mesonia aestuariivivens]